MKYGILIDFQLGEVAVPEIHSTLMFAIEYTVAIRGRNSLVNISLLLSHFCRDIKSEVSQTTTKSSEWKHVSSISVRRSHAHSSRCFGHAPGCGIHASY